jgi:hypothetical protein
MHKCINNSIGNVYHLEQFVSDFFPYSQKQLGFDKPATIRFESDQDNAGVMLGKTAYYDPESMEVVLYVDGRHPKDVMRSLSHELVHHAQNCRGDFTGQNDAGPGYAQNDPHLRKMEREAYTKGNLIFRDFEDLIKTGKINIEIDFSDSGEPKMSLKEWKNNEINTKLMKKWGFLKESKEVTTEGECPEHGAGCGCPDLEEGWGWRAEDDEGRGKDYEGVGSREHDDMEGDQFGMGDPLKKDKLEEKTEGEETYDYGEDEGHDEYRLDHDPMSRSHRHNLERDEEYDEEHERRREPGTHFGESTDSDIEEGSRSRPAPHGVEARHLGDDPDTYVGPALGKGMKGLPKGKKRHVVGGHPGVADFIMPNEPQGETPPPGQRIIDPRHLKTKTTKVPPVKREGKISVKEAKQITRRIIERIRKEGK